MLIKAGTHPDLFQIGRPKEKADIPVALLIGEANKRMQEGLCHDISLKPFMGGRRVAIIDDADHLNEEGANCLLKTLEEPPPHSVLILIGTSAERQLPTIRSRSQIIRFAPLEPEVLAGLLLAQDLVADPAQARQLAEYSGGSLQRAAELADPELWDFRRAASQPACGFALGQRAVGQIGRGLCRCGRQGGGAAARPAAADRLLRN